jgi:phosphoribosylamine--glycine ligase
VKVLIVGQGGREHVLAAKAAQSRGVEQVYCAPGNAGMSEIAECVHVEGNQALLDFAKTQKIDLTIIGPEAPLVDGIVDLFKEAGLCVFGPNKYASQLEGSKIFSKEIMQALNIPTAEYAQFSEIETAIKHLDTISFPSVIKADGLAAGKGVTIAQNKAEAEAAITSAMQDKTFGSAGDNIIIEEFLEGEEASLIAIADGETVKLLASSQDHKRIFDGDEGPNTGGMGAYSPAPIVTESISREAEEKVFKPIIAEMKRLGHPFIGFLYAGIMVTDKGMRVLEFNVRFGDPEAQVVLERLDSDLIELILACTNVELSQFDIAWKPESAVTVVLASAGYPASSTKGAVIEGISKIKDLENTAIYHAGTRKNGDAVETDGGRVLSIVGTGSDIEEAVKRVYVGVDQIKFEGMQFRRDIAHRALSRV